MAKFKQTKQHQNIAKNSTTAQTISKIAEGLFQCGDKGEIVEDLHHKGEHVQFNFWTDQPMCCDDAKQSINCKLHTCFLKSTRVTHVAFVTFADRKQHQTISEKELTQLGTFVCD